MKQMVEVHDAIELQPRISSIEIQREANINCMDKYTDTVLVHMGVHMSKEDPRLLFEGGGIDLALSGASRSDTCHELSYMIWISTCLLYTSPSPRDATLSRMPSSA